MTPPSLSSSSLYVAGGGAFGSWLRFLVGKVSIMLLGPIRASAFPWGTLFVNVAGSLAMGLLVGWLARYGSHGEGTRLLLGVGVLGGFTTFSSFSMEFALLIERGTPAMAALYVAITLLAGFSGMFAGLALMRNFA
jgi:fluoride exporter